LPDASAVFVNAGATLSLGGAESIGSLNGAGFVAAGSSQLTLGSNNVGAVFSGLSARAAF
jgi:hypothetical protein